MTVKRSVPANNDCNGPAITISMKLDSPISNNLGKTNDSDSNGIWPANPHANTYLKENTRCKYVDTREYEDILHAASIYKIYQRSWDIQGATLLRVCGTGGDFLKCNCLGSSNNDDKFITRCKNVTLTARSPFVALFPYLVSQTLPYMILFSKIYGPVCVTPFYSVICANVTKIPSDIFMLSNLNLTNVVTNSVFRHELVFNPELFIKDPTFTCNDPSLGYFWMRVISEINDIKESPLTYGPLVVLPQLIEGLRVLLKSVIPESLSSEAEYRLDPSRLLCGDRNLIIDFVEEFVCFLCTVLDACVTPLRRKLVEDMKFNICRGTQQVSRLVKGVMIAIDLLNFTKVDQINSRIKERASFLYATSYTIEKVNFRNFVKKGGVDMKRAYLWLIKQPEQIAHFDSDITSQFKTPEKTLELQILSKLVHGFVHDFIARDNPDLKLNLFPLDISRIKVIRKRFKKAVLRKLVSKMVKVYHKHDAKDRSALKHFFSVPEVYNSKAYLLLEQRVKLQLSAAIFSCIAEYWYRDEVAGLCDFGDLEELKKMDNSDEFMMKEIIIILSLHWHSAHEFYCTMDFEAHK